MLNVYWGKGDIYGRVLVRDNMGDSVIANICKSNALFTSIVSYYEKAENGEKKLYRQPWWWFADKDHLKNCLGLTKGYDNILKGEILQIYLNRTAPKEIKKACKLIANTLEIDLMWFDDLDEYIIDNDEVIE